ncbi:MAG: 30S ribosomal protein S6 [Anaerolineales bacterium]
MRNYEVAFIADPDLDEEGLTALEERVKSWVEAAQGKTIKVDRWGKRRFAYPIGRRNEGYYVFIQTEMPPAAGLAIERDLRLTEQVLRFLITQQEGMVPAGASPAADEPRRQTETRDTAPEAGLKGEN